MTIREVQGQALADRDARMANGKERRKEAPRRSHGEWEAPPGRPDPIRLLRAQDRGRMRHLLPIKYGRMLASPFAFLRGSAVIMAADLATTPVSGIDTLLCGDAHLSNFGLFATPERNLVFDLNDFDEAYPGPCEWDLKRLAVSGVVAGSENGLDSQQLRQVAMFTTLVYREAMARFAGLPIMDTWYYQVKAKDALALVERYHGRKAVKGRRTVKKARARTQEATLAKLTEMVDGTRRFVNDPPLLVRFEDLLTDEQKRTLLKRNVIENAWSEYLGSLPEERRLLLRRFRISDVALRVGGVGSVGTRCGIALLEGGSEDDALILQFKEAGPSVLEAYLPEHGYENPAARVVVSQRVLQASSDTFLGWHQGTLERRHFYWRQLKDWKGSFSLEGLDETGLRAYLQVCSLCLARAHARTGDPVAIAGYLGTGSSFEKAIADFAVAYADQNEQDYRLLVKAVKAGRIEAETGV